MLRVSKRDGDGELLQRARLHPQFPRRSPPTSNGPENIHVIRALFEVDKISFDQNRNIFQKTGPARCAAFGTNHGRAEYLPGPKSGEM